MRLCRRVEPPTKEVSLLLTSGNSGHRIEKHGAIVVERCLAPGFRARSGFPPESQVPKVFATPGGSDSRDRFRVEISGRVTCAALIKLAANKTMPHTGEMSALGQKLKSSRRAYVFCSSLNNGHLGHLCQPCADRLSCSSRPQKWVFSFF